METPADEEVKRYLDEHPEVAYAWGIPGSARFARITFVLLNIVLIAIIIGAIAYFALGDSSMVSNQVSGLIIVLVLIYAVSVVRIFQLRAERQDLPGFRELLKSRLTGHPENDVDAQVKAEQDDQWSSNRYTYICRMIGIAGLVILAINTYQVGTQDFARTLIFDGAILAYLLGALWNNFAFKTDLLTLELEERTRATIRYQSEHPSSANPHALPGTEDEGDEW